MWRFAFNHGIWDPDFDQLNRVFRCLPLFDQQNSLKFAYRRDFKSYLAARLLILYVAKRFLNLDPVEVDVRRDCNGRPYLKGVFDFDFNPSHNGQYTVLTACYGMRTGVDVMRLELPRKLPITTPNAPSSAASSSVNCFLLKMKSLFAPREWAFLSSPKSMEIERLRNFFRLWCLKEAFLKNLGTGLKTDPSHVEFDLTGDTPKCEFPGIMRSEWVFEEHNLPHNHVAAVAWQRASLQTECPSKESFFELSFDELMKDLDPWRDVTDDFWFTYASKEPSPPSARRPFDANARTQPD